MGAKLGWARRPRGIVVGVVCSLLLHVLVATLLYVDIPWLQRTPPSTSRGEPIIVDIAPERPEEKAPLGNPARRQGPDAPAPAAPRAAPARPQVARAPSPAPRPAEAPRPTPTPAPAPVPAPKADDAGPTEAAKPPEPAAPRPDPAPPSESAAARPAPATPPADPRVASVPPAPASPRTGGIWRGGGGGLQGGRGGIEGEAVPMDSVDPKYVDYMRLVRERIYQQWAYPADAVRRGLMGELRIDFGIAKDGRLAFIELRQSSGVDILDRFAMNAVKLADPFPPVPDTIGNKTGLPIAGTFTYHLTSPLDRLILR